MQHDKLVEVEATIECNSDSCTISIDRKTVDTITDGTTTVTVANHDYIQLDADSDMGA